jgi:hypothetical protein
MITTAYVCNRCKAQDQDRSPEGVRPPLALNCWKCHAGLGKDLSEMQASGAGMFPVSSQADAA